MGYADDDDAPIIESGAPARYAEREIMKKVIIALLMVAAISGCVSTSNKAHEYIATPTPDLVGQWVGSGGGQTQYMLIRASGTGELCWESMGNYKTTPVTISDDKIISFSEANFKRNSDGTISSCVWGICMNFKRAEQVAAACREWLAK